MSIPNDTDDPVAYASTLGGILASTFTDYAAGIGYVMQADAAAQAGDAETAKSLIAAAATAFTGCTSLAKATYTNLPREAGQNEGMG